VQNDEGLFFDMFCPEFPAPYPQNLAQGNLLIFNR